MAEVGDGFLINGHFGCVVHVNAPRGLALVRVFADPMTYAIHLGHLNALVHAFSTSYKAEGAA